MRDGKNVTEQRAEPAVIFQMRGVMMRKNLGVQTAVFPLPVLIVAAYDENGTVQAMNAAWGVPCDTDKIALFLDENHATTKAIRRTKAFTVSLADKAHIGPADYLGIVSGNRVPEKFAGSGCHAEKSAYVNAPVITEFPVTMECELAEAAETETLFAIVGTVRNVSADERVLSDSGKVDPLKLGALIFDTFGHGYYTAGEKAGQAWDAGKELARVAQRNG